MFFAHAVEELRDPERRFTLSPEDIALLNPNTHTCPIFRSRKDAELTKAIYRRVPVLVREAREGRPAENPWSIRFSTMFHMSNDSHLFLTREQLEAEGWELDGNVFRRDGAEYLPLYEAKMIHHFNHRWATLQAGETGESPLAEKLDPNGTVLPRYWVEAREVYLRTADLPKELLDGLRDRNTSVIVSSVAHLLFAHWLRHESDGLAEGLAGGNLPGGISSAWKHFVERHPFVRDFVATPRPDVKTNGKRRTAWYAADKTAVSTYLDFADRYPHFADTAPRLRDEAEALEFAEDCLKRATPRWLTGWRDITNSTNERTVVGGVFPLAAVGNNLPVWTLATKPGADASVSFVEYRL